MRKKILCLLSLFFIFSLLMGDEISDTQKRLEKIQKDLQEMERKATQTSQKKKTTDVQLQTTLKEKQKVELEKKKTEEIFKQKQQELTKVSTELKSVDEQVRELKTLQNNQLNLLLRLRINSSTTKIKPKEEHCLTAMTAQTREKLNQLGDVQVVLSEEKKEVGKEVTVVKSDLYAKTNLSKKLNTTVKTLETQKKQLTKEEQKLQNQIAQLRKDAAQLEALIASLTAKSKASGEISEAYKNSFKSIAWPLRGKIIRNFGQETRSYGTSVISNGIDIAVPEWTTVVASDDGEVVFSGPYGGQGKLIIIDHKNGFFTVYSYNNELLVSRGAQVKKGQPIAKSGMTGSASEPCLHFEVRKDGKAVNPLAYLE